MKEQLSGNKDFIIQIKGLKIGKYEYDFISCFLWDAVAGSACEYCRKGDTIGIRGRLVSKTRDVVFNGELEQVKRVQTLELIAERVFFISVSGKGKDYEGSLETEVK